MAGETQDAILRASYRVVRDLCRSQAAIVQEAGLDDHPWPELRAAAARIDALVLEPRGAPAPLVLPGGGRTERRR